METSAWPVQIDRLSGIDRVHVIDHVHRLYCNNNGIFMAVLAKTKRIKDNHRHSKYNKKRVTEVKTAKTVFQP